MMSEEWRVGALTAFRNELTAFGGSVRVMLTKEERLY